MQFRVFKTQNKSWYHGWALANWPYKTASFTILNTLLTFTHGKCDINDAYVMSDIPRMEKKGGYVDQQVL